MKDIIDLDIEALDDQARGVATRDGRRFFIEGALPGERVRAAIGRAKPNYAVGGVRSVLRASPHRVEPRCPHFGVCGGCTLQHIDAATQVALKQRELEDVFERAAGLAPARILPALQGPDWAYRHRARLAVRFVPSRGGVLLGFHERKSSFVADIRVCHVLPAAVSDLLGPLHRLVAALSIPHRIPQIEVAVGGDGLIVLVLRHLLELSDGDRDRLRAFAARHGIVWWLQPGGPDTAAPLDAGAAHPGAEGATKRRELAYGLPRFGLNMRFRPTDFIQANMAANRALVSRALDLLEAGPGDRVMDLFCGLGNFTLPIATQAKEVLGVEGSAALLERARQAATDHGLEGRAHFACTDLFSVDAHWLREQGRFDLMLLDPPREGAPAVAEALAALSAAERPRRIVYVSCNPATLARDTAILAHRGGYRLKACGVVNMFPHTSHVESVSVLE